MIRPLGILATAFLAAVSALAPAANGAGLPLDGETAVNAAALAALCPDCAKRGFYVCGGEAIGYGPGFARTFPQGDPARGYLVTFVIGHDEARRLLRRPEPDAALRQRFEEIRLVVTGPALTSPRVLGPPRSLAVTMTPEQRACLAQPELSWSCCLGDGGSDQHCPKKADAPRVSAEWQDGTERLTFTFVPFVGKSTLRRVGPGRRTLYWCLTEEAAFLRPIR
jgi:hypothetical protein